MSIGLPTPLNSFVGRKAELSEIRRALITQRLVTLTGPGGSGKTRLALQAAEHLSRAHRHGAAFVPLDSLVDANRDRLLETVSRSLGLSQASGDSRSVVLDYLADREMLLLLDNCEHLLHLCLPVVGEILAAAPAVRIMLTSRQVLDSRNEHIVRVDPLPVPGASGLKEARSLDVVRLFEQRASESLHDFTVTEENWEQVLDLCARLEGLPLAIELAVRWLRTLPLAELMIHLAASANLLSQSRQSGVDRQRTLNGAIGWSYNLLSPAEQTLWNRLAYFSGTPGSNAIAAVCGTTDLDALLKGLVDKSVVRREVRNGEECYHMLDLFRQFGRDRLREAGEHDEIAARHLQYYLEFAVQNKHAWEAGEDQESVYSRLRREHDDVQSALGHALRSIAPEPARQGMRLVSDLYFYWAHCGQVAAGRYWAELALSSVEEPSYHWARTRWLVAHMACITGDTTTASLEAASAMRWATLHDDAEISGFAFMARGLVALVDNQPMVTIKWCGRSAEAFAHAGNRSQQVVSLAVIAIATAFAGDLDTAGERGRSVLALCERHGQHWAKTIVHYGLALTALFGDDHEAARKASCQGLGQAKAFNNVVGARLHIDLLARIADSAAQHRFAARLLGIAHRLRPIVDTRSLQTSPTWTVPQSECERNTVQALGTEEFRVEFARGAAHSESLEQAVDFIFGDHDAVLRPEIAGGRLTAREAEVAELVARGLSNKEIAAELVISRRTAESHVARILNKLDAESRAHVADRLAGRGVEHVSARPG